MPLTMPADDHGLIRIFKVADPLPTGLSDRDPAALQALFGTDALDPDYIDVVDTSQLAGLSLLDYLHQGYDIPADTADEAALRGISGTVVLLMSRAARGVAVDLTLAPQISHITTTGDPARLRVPPRAPAPEAAKGRVSDTKPAPSQAAMSGRIATYALIAMCVVVAIVILIAS